MGDGAITLPDWIRLTPVDGGGEGGALVRGTACRTRAGLFAEWAEALAFPDHFGHNWDAFVDCLLDLAWPDLTERDRDGAAPIVVTVSDADQLLIDEPSGTLTTLLEVVDDVASGRTIGRAAEGPRLRLVLRFRDEELVRRLQLAWAHSAG
jgi:hypothetical protein